MNTISAFDFLAQGLKHKITAYSEKSWYVILVISGLVSHSTAFGLTLIMVPKYAIEANPFSSTLGLAEYFPVTMLLLFATYLMVWRSSLSTTQKVLLSMVASGACYVDFSHDLGLFVKLVQAGAIPTA